LPSPPPAGVLLWAVVGTIPAGKLEAQAAPSGSFFSTDFVLEALRRRMVSWDGLRLITRWEAGLRSRLRSFPGPSRSPPVARCAMVFSPPAFRPPAAWPRRPASMWTEGGVARWSGGVSTAPNEDCGGSRELRLRPSDCRPARARVNTPPSHGWVSSPDLASSCRFWERAPRDQTGVSRSSRQGTSVTADVVAYAAARDTGHQRKAQSFMGDQDERDLTSGVGRYRTVSAIY